MTRTAVLPVLRDPELLELLRDEPELLAISDAIAATAPRRHPRRMKARVLSAAAVLVFAVVLALASPWSESRGGVLQRALAALSGGSVLHVVLASDSTDSVNLDLRSGAVRPTTFRVETWFDSTRGLRRTVQTRDGRVIDDSLATPQGVWSRQGRVPTCAWIAAHPLRATRLHVSCVLSGRNGTTPRHIPEARPTEDPAFETFVTGYKHALASGTARNLGEGKLGRQLIYWIEFNARSLTPGTSPSLERVAVDRRTFRPLLQQVVVHGKVVAQTRVVEIESRPFEPSLFARPKVDTTPSPAGGSVVASRPVSLELASRALNGATRSLGGSFAGMPLSDARIDTLTTGYGPLSRLPVTRSPGVQFLYGDSSPLVAGSYLRVREALSAQIAYGMTEASSVPSGSLQLTRVINEIRGARGITSVRRTLWQGRMHVGRLQIALEGSSRSVLIAAARALEGRR